jgi:hypothetical protein
MAWELTLRVTAHEDNRLLTLQAALFDLNRHRLIEKFDECEALRIVSQCFGAPGVSIVSSAVELENSGGADR